jgi:hypothetical protein
MYQTIDGYYVFVVDFETMPKLPINWKTEEEKPYALALAIAIHEGVITEPGKYGIHIPADDKPMLYSIFAIEG